MRKTAGEVGVQLSILSPRPEQKFSRFNDLLENGGHAARPAVRKRTSAGRRPADLSWLKAGCGAPWSYGPMPLLTFQAYLTDSRGRNWFEPVLSESEVALVSALRKRLATEDIQEIRVEHQGRVLFTLER